MFEVYSDVTPFKSMIQRTLVLELETVSLAFGVVWALLFYAVHLGNRQLAREHRRNVALASSIARAESASQAKSRFLMKMSHELRTPLNAVIGFAELIRDTLPCREPAHPAYADNIHTAGLQLLGVIENVLDLVNAERSAVAVEARQTALRPLVEEAVAKLQPRAEAGQITLRFEAPAKLPDLVTDTKKISQILANLLDNAIKFTPPYGSVLVRLEAHGGWQRLVVADTGVGIAPEDIPVCLMPFGQADDSIAKRFQGTGLGLPIAKLFAEALGGSLQIRSSPGRGTVVSVTLPVRPAAAEPAPVLAAA